MRGSWTQTGRSASGRGCAGAGRVPAGRPRPRAQSAEPLLLGVAPASLGRALRGPAPRAPARRSRTAAGTRTPASADPCNDSCMPWQASTPGSRARGATPNLVRQGPAGRSATTSPQRTSQSNTTAVQRRAGRQGGKCGSIPPATATWSAARGATSGLSATPPSPHAAARPRHPLAAGRASAAGPCAERRSASEGPSAASTRPRRAHSSRRNCRRPRAPGRHRSGSAADRKAQRSRGGTRRRAASPPPPGKLPPAGRPADRQR
mmetsp:Transcript_86897/g.240966  ORF Transcript_86897/g.240966 Transcript_86897/m.240966 type:complete len:263 (-) Transcript_86897:12-800(-)